MATQQFSNLVIKLGFTVVSRLCLPVFARFPEGKAEEIALRWSNYFSFSSVNF